MTRQSPIRHKVRSYRRESKTVNSYLRGNGQHLSKIANPTFKQKESFQTLISEPNVLPKFKLQFIRRALKDAYREMTEQEQNFITENIYKIKDYPGSKISLSSRHNDKVYVTMDFDEMSRQAIYHPFGGSYDKRLGIIVASEMLHEATHNHSLSDEKEPKRITKTFLERKLREKSTLFVKIMIEVNEKEDK
jgi:hypothetical protein